MCASSLAPFWMITLFGSAVPSMTTVLPLGGADFSGVVAMIFVGAAWYLASSALAVVTPEPDELAFDDELEEPELVSDPDEPELPQAASAAVAATTPRSA